MDGPVSKGQDAKADDSTEARNQRNERQGAAIARFRKDPPQAEDEERGDGKDHHDIDTGETCEQTRSGRIITGTEQSQGGKGIEHGNLRQMDWVLPTINPVDSPCRGSAQMQRFILVFVNDLQIGTGAQEHGIFIDIPQFGLEAFSLLESGIFS